MHSQSISCLRTGAIRTLLPLLFAFATSAHATAVDPVEVTVDPVLPEVSVSTPPAKQFLAGYTVKINNSTGSQVNRPFVLWGRARAVLQDSSEGAFAALAAAPQSPAQCITVSEVVPGFGTFLVRCEFPNVPTNLSEFTLNFQTPPTGDPNNPVKSLKFEWVNTRPFTGLSDVDYGATSVTLITQPASEANKSLNTVVPSSGLTVFTGTFGNGGLGNPGSAATRTDPFTTTVVIPPFTFAPFTTASVLESVGSSCNPGFSQCYFNDLKIPGTFANLEIYLRVDVSRITPAGNINTAQIEYIDDSGVSQGPIPDCTTAADVPVVPRCIAARKRYPLSVPGAPTDAWKGDWEFKIRAVNNGRNRFF